MISTSLWIPLAIMLCTTNWYHEVIGSSCDITSINMTHCRSYNGVVGVVCKGVAGQNITIPCGNVDASNGTTYVYTNTTDGLTDVLQNSTECLQLSLTPFHNNSEILCDLSSNYISHHIYRLVVDLNIMCPLLANPTPTCQWTVYDCKTFEFIEASADIRYEINNCSLKMHDFQVKHLSLCYNCIATNYLGTANTTIEILTGSVTYCQARKSITVSPESVVLDEGANITFSCTVVGISGCFDMVWEFKGSDSNISTEVFVDHCEQDNIEYNLEECTLIGTLVISNAAVNQTGNYTCITSDEHEELRASAKLNVTARAAITTQDSGRTNLLIILGSVLGSSVVLLVTVMASIGLVVFVWWKVCKKYNSKFSYHYHINYGEDIDYDIFLSFAEEDRDAAETMIKEPLEKHGYSVCWHHDAFLPGYSIEDNMERSIYTSRFTVALISKPFIDSEFCMMEVNITKRKMQERSENLLIPVIVKEESEIPADLLKITYVHLNDPSLIERLKAKLGQPILSMKEEEPDTCS